MRRYLPGRGAEFDALGELQPEEEYGDLNRLENAGEFNGLFGRLVVEVRWLEELYLRTGLRLRFEVRCGWIPDPRATPPVPGRTFVSSSLDFCPWLVHRSAMLLGSPRSGSKRSRFWVAIVSVAAASFTSVVLFAPSAAGVLPPGGGGCTECDGWKAVSPDTAVTDQGVGDGCYQNPPVAPWTAILYCGLSHAAPPQAHDWYEGEVINDGPNYGYVWVWGESQYNGAICKWNWELGGQGTVAYQEDLQNTPADQYGDTCPWPLMGAQAWYSNDPPGTKELEESWFEK